VPRPARDPGSTRSSPRGQPRVTVYHAEGCHLCQRALTVVEAARAELGFELELVDIGGDPELEARYRELLPVVEIDGQLAFTYFVPPDALRARFS
jgi:glutaredoxin